MTHFFRANLEPKRAFLLALFGLFIAAPTYVQAQNCTNDTIPPVAICDQQTAVAIGFDNPSDCYGPAGVNNLPPALGGGYGAGVTWVHAQTFDDGSYDDCNFVKFTIRRLAPYSAIVENLNAVRGAVPCDNPLPTFPSEFERAISETDSIKFYCGEVGSTQTLVLRAYQVDANGSLMLNGSGLPIFNECLVNVSVEDKIKPVCPGDVTVSCSDFDPTLAAYGPTDNCCIDAVNNTGINYSLFNNNCKEGVISRSFTVADCYGNTNSCSQLIEVTYEQDYFVKFPDDLILTVDNSNSQFGEPVFFGEDCELMGVSYQDEFFINGTDNEIRQERTWTIINWCTYNPVLPVINVPNPNPNALPDHPSNLPGPIVSEFGTVPLWAPTIVKVNPSDPTATDFSTFWNANANAYRYKQIIRNRFYVGVEGTVFSDTSANCAYETGESLLEDWTVKATGLVSGDVVEVLTDVNGYYFVSLSGVDTLVSITLVSSSNFGQNCQTEYTVNTILSETVVQDVPVYLEDGCALLSVGVATPRLRRCFANRYTVQACNLSSGTVPDAYTEVTLDPQFDFISSSIPGSLVSGNTYSFQLGDLEPGECESFTIDFLLSCEAELGATHCLEAHVFPYDDCSEGSNWSGADVEVNATCDGDSVRFVITNVGSGDMTQLLDFVVVEDVVMRQEGTFQLNVGGALNFSQLANGSTWRLEAQEEPQHPWGGPQAIALEGCGGLNNPGLVNLFPLSDSDPFEALDCLENIGAYDPNDKQGFPEGYGSQHYIKANTDLEYLIRFQNTGTDTAFTVVVLDTLSQQLDAASVRVQVASHPMEFAMLEGGVLRFSFNNILLPDSNVNQAASNGFVKFRITQKPDLADGTIIENSAAIYFDFNDPVLTNTTFHTIGTQFITVSTDDPELKGLLRAYPNPASDAVIFDLKDWANAGRFEIFNSLGQVVSTESFTGKQFRFERKNLPAGIYHFQIISNNTKTASGKIMLK